VRHCHFSILCNELPFLKQKMDFMYHNFSQLIFFDLCINCEPMAHSTDGSWEYLNNYPDPENKIVIIDCTDLSGIEANNGKSLKAKQRMFRLGSSFVRDDIDVFWCQDLDEFYDAGFIRDVERILNYDPEIISIRMNWLTFWRERDIVLSRPKGYLNERNRAHDSGLVSPPRVARHKPGQIYPHCELQSLGKVYDVDHKDGMLFHFAWVGDDRVWEKRHHQPISVDDYRLWFENVWKKFDTSVVGLKYDGIIPGFNKVVPNPQANPLGLRRYEGHLPEYIDIEQMWGDLESKVL